MQSSRSGGVGTRTGQLLWHSLLACLISAPAAFAGELDCGSLENAYGPYDYTNPDHRANKIPIVEGAHFQPEVEALLRSPTGLGTVISNIDYTLRAVPNHHRALASVARYQLQGGNMQGARSAECYFDRALRFKPDDGTVHLIYGGFLHRKHDYDEAEKEYGTAISLMPQSAEAHYDLGLLYSDRGMTSRAKEQAMIAYKLGYPLRGLRNRLEKAGAWSSADEREAFSVTPAPAAEEPGTPSSSGASVGALPRGAQPVKPTAQPSPAQ